MADFRTSTPTAGVTCNTGSETFILSYITVSGRPLALKRMKIGARSVAATDLPMTVRIVVFDTDGTGTTNTPVAIDPAVTASLPGGEHTYTVAPSGTPRAIWHGTVWPQSTEVVSLIDPATGVGLLVPSGKTVAIGVTPLTSNQVVDAQLTASD